MRQFGVVGFWMISMVAFSQELPVQFRQQGKHVEVTIGKQMVTRFFDPGPEVLKKPVLFPVLTPGGTVVTRGWPVDPRPGDAQDHPHHVGIWFNYESVNDHDYWNNSIEVEKAGDKRAFGTIRTTQVGPWKNGPKGTLPWKAEWVDSQGQRVLEEETVLTFQGTSTYTLIDRTTTLTASSNTVLFRDIKDGLYAIRVRRELEHPARGAASYSDASGKVTEVAAAQGEPTGRYRNQAGILGEDTWGKRSPWVTLEGRVDGKPVSITILDHPENPGYPAYWHTRGYGLFSINPLGQSIFTQGKEQLNFTLGAGKSVTFRYRMILADRHFSQEELNGFFNR